MLPTKIQSIGVSVQEKKRIIDFQDFSHGGCLGFPIGTILAIFDHQVSRCFLPSFKSIGLFVQEKKAKIDLNDDGYFGFSMATVLAIFYLQVTPMLPTKFQVNWPFGSGIEAKNRFSRWWSSWISDRNNFSFFLSTGHHDASYQGFESIGLSVQEKKRKIDFQDGDHGGHLGYPIRTILAILSTSQPNASYQVSSQMAFWFRRRCAK